jgi:hypothetical protein
MRRARAAAPWVRYGSMLFSNSGFGCQALHNVPCRATVLSAVGACPPHDGVRRRWWINVESAVALSSARQASLPISEGHTLSNARRSSRTLGYFGTHAPCGSRFANFAPTSLRASQKDTSSMAAPTRCTPCRECPRRGSRKTGLPPTDGSATTVKCGRLRLILRLLAASAGHRA